MNWDIERAAARYNLAHWSGGYFEIGAQGDLLARPDRTAAATVNLHRLAQDLEATGLRLPVLVRFADILRDRVNLLCDAFARAMAAHDYRGRYLAAYPIKVNQQASVVEEILAQGGPRVGLEAGSKPELLAVLALLREPDGIVICNGYKDREYVRLALIGRRLGHRVHLVIEKLSELELVLTTAAELDITPLLGLRVRLASVGAGKWQNTGGEKSKFGLSAAQALMVVERLRTAGRLDSLRLLHFHLGSQVANIRDIQRALHEGARYYAQLRALGVPLETLDVGGGLAVDYEGTRSRSDCSMNYSVDEYAHQVVHTLAELCRAQNLPQPDLVTECGRAMTAHHAVLITQVIDHEAVPDAAPQEPPEPAAPAILHELWNALHALGTRPALEIWHDAAYWLAEAQQLYAHGLLDLAGRARAELLYQAICLRVRPLLRDHGQAQREARAELDEKLADKYFLNFSLFQSMPDIWALNQVFPIMPLHRLNEEPTRRAVLQDLTCDSDGRVQHYVQDEGIAATLALHPLRTDERYLIGFFLLGAYQEILGDMHNLFGDTDSVNVRLGPNGYEFFDACRGDDVASVLRAVRISAEDLHARYRRKLAGSGLSPGEQGRYLAELDEGLRGYTYFEDS